MVLPLKKILVLLCLFAGFPFSVSRAYSQAIPTATDSKWQVGVAGAFVNPDYTPHNTGGVGAYASYNFLPNFGVEARTQYAFKTNGVREYTFASGPRYNLPLKRLDPFVAGMIGYGHFSYKTGPNPVNGSDSFLITYAGGIDLHATRHLNVRVFSIEYQSWVGFLPDGLSPIVYSAGIAYHR